MADYAISNVPRRVVYAASGTGPYAFTFEILSQTDIAVYKASTLLTLTTDYTVTINANGTGSVTLVLTAGTSNITIVGAKNIQRTTDFTTGGDLFANTLNDELDNQTIFIQQVAETAERGLKAPVVDPTDINMTLPAKASRVGTVLAFNATTGNPEAGPSIGSVTTVAAQSANINTVATNIGSVNTVAGNITNVNTVAGISSNVTTVAGSISNVNTVADDLNEPTSEINTVAVDIANVNNVGNNISNVNTVAGVSASVTTVAGISSNVTTVAGVAAGVTTVAGISSNVTTVAGISANVTTVAGISSNVTTVATNNANVTTVAGSIGNVNTVAGNIANVNQVAADTTVINSASANAATATTKAAEALASANSASASAAAASAVALGNEPVRHSVRPSLLLDFANTKTLDPRITFTRASTGTFYDGKTVAKAEENLLIRSQEFESGWSASNSTITVNAGVAPDGTTTAEKLVGTGANPFISQSVSFSGACVLSIFAKKGELNWIRVTPSTGATTAAVWFNLDTGVVGTASGTASPTGSIVSVGNGWFRCVVTVANIVAQTGVVIACTNADNTTSGYTGNGTDGIFIWGAQLEQRSSVTAYTATTTAPITNYIPALQTAAAGVARFEHNPVTGESLGLEIEEQRTNLSLQSQDFTTTWGYTRGSALSNVVIAPDGTLTADKLIDTTDTGTHFAGQGITTTAASHTFSVYAKAGELSYIMLYHSQSVSGAVFNLSAGTIGSSTGTLTSSIQSVGNGWYRCSITSLATAASNAYRIYLGVTGSLLESYTGDGYKGVYIWGAQLEAGAFATSYIPTVASQVTRSADAASMTGTNFSSWYNTNEGNYYMSFKPFETSAVATTRFWLTADNNTDKRIMYTATGGTGVSTFDGTNIINGGIIVTQPVAQVVSTYTATNRTLTVNGGTVVSGNSINRYRESSSLQIGSVGSIGGMTIKKLTYYPKRLSDAELVSLSTI